jgi:hypothetical protein
MNFIDTVKKAIEKRNRILTNKKEELLLLENRKTSIDDDLKEAEKEFFKFVDDEVKIESYETKKIEKEDVVKKIDEVKEQIRLLEANFYVDYEIQDIEKELKSLIVNSGLLKDLEKVEKKINELKELAKTIEVKRYNITTEFAKYMQDTIYLPSDKKELYKREIKDLQEKELNMKIANSDITAFIDHVQGYYRKHKKIFK